METKSSTKILMVTLVLILASSMLLVGYYYGKSSVVCPHRSILCNDDDHAEEEIDQEAEEGEKDLINQSESEDDVDVDNDFLVDLKAFMDARMDRDSDEANKYLGEDVKKSDYGLTQLVGTSSPSYSGYEIISADQSTISSTDGPFNIYFVEVKIDESVSGEKTSYFEETQVWVDNIGFVSHVVDELYISNRLNY